MITIFAHVILNNAYLQINTLVDFPIDGLNMSEHCIDPSVAVRDGGGLAPIYDLYAVSNHYGRMGFGHYTAFCRDLKYQNGKYWYTLDDSRCKIMSEEEVCSAAGYVLFYKLRR